VRREHGEVRRFVSSLVAIIVLVVVAPLALSLAARRRFGSSNPFDGVDPPWEWFGGGASSTLTGPLPDDTVVDALIRLSLAVAWLAVAVIVVTTVVEVVHLRRHAGVPMPDVRGMSWAQHIGRGIAVGLVAIVPASTPSPSIAAAVAGLTSTVEPVDRVSATTTDVMTGSIAGDDGVRTSAGFRIHVVQPGESVYSIAERLAHGRGLDVMKVADAIVDANLDADVAPGQRFTTPAYVEAGWTLRVPADVVSGASGDRPSHREPGDTAEDRSAAIHVVRPGDTLWDIAGAELGDTTAWPRIWEANAGREMGDGRTFDDPDLILPGWELRLDSATAPPEPISDDPPASTREEPAVDTPPSVADDAEPTIGAVPAPTPRPAPAPVATSDTALAPDGAPRPVATPAPAAAPVTTTTTSPAVVAGNDGVDDAGAALSEPPAPAPVRLEHAALLAAGVLALIGVRRRRRLRSAAPRHRVPEPRPGIVDGERRLRAVDPGERALRIDVACRAAACELIGTGVRIGWIETTADGDVTLRLTGAADLPAPWTGAGAQWCLGAEVPVEILRHDARRVGQPCIALVQLGTTDGGTEILIDLEACSVLAVDADARQALDVVTALVAGLASSMYAETAHVIAVAIPPAALLGHRNGNVAATVDDALHQAAMIVGTTAQQERPTFELRSLRTGGEAWEPAVVLAGSPLVDQCVPQPGPGVALVVPVSRQGGLDAPVRLVGSDVGWELRGFGTAVTLTPLGLSTADLTLIESLLEEADRPLVLADSGESDRGDMVDDEIDDDDDDDDDEVGDDDDEDAEAHAIVVGLLGGVEVRDTTGQPARFERSKTVELIAWLATHRDRSTRTGARTALWELDVRDATFANVVSEARRGLARLVPPPDGEEWVGRTLSEQLPLHARVVTDAELVRTRLDRARLQPPDQALRTLRPAVELIRDMPFAGTSYLWPDAEGITSNLVLLAMSAATEFAGHALSVGDIDGVFWATGRGLQVLPAHEELIGLRMRAHARAGDLAGVRQEWEAYERVLVADTWSDGEPAPKLLALRHELLSP
jgi:hypothetical protein